MNNEKSANLLNSLNSCRDGLSGKENLKVLQEIRKELHKKSKNETLYDFCNSLGNKTRLNILKILKKEDYCVCELEVILNKSQASISHHLRILENVNLIRGWKKGKFTFYVFNKEIFKQGIEMMRESFLD